jgi:hypothetical protein
MCLEAISRHPQSAGEIVRSPEEVCVSRMPNGRYVYINFINPASLPVGSVYRTWIVQFSQGKEPVVTFFRSRRGLSGDDTLPPD